MEFTYTFNGETVTKDVPQDAVDKFLDYCDGWDTDSVINVFLTEGMGGWYLDEWCASARELTLLIVAMYDELITPKIEKSISKRKD